jgi:DNA-binding FadR family transcriptional regulator
VTVIENMSQTDVVVSEIKRMIVDGDLAPNAQLPIEKELADNLGVSRSSLREGVRALSLLGVLETRQGAGTFVTGLDPSLLLSQLSFVVDLQHAENAVHLHSVRRVLETEAAAEAALLITDAEVETLREVLVEFERALSADPIDHRQVLELDIRFHSLVAAASRNPILEALIEGFSGRTAGGRLRRAINEDGVESLTLVEHRAIADALEGHSPDRARVRMANHLLFVEDYLRTKPAQATDQQAESPSSSEPTPRS